MTKNRVSPAVKTDPKAIEMSVKKTMARFVVFLARAQSACCPFE